MSDKSFSDFTNLYEISKTLRFELKPVGETEKLLEENQVFWIDKQRRDKYEQVKPYFDKLHLDFINFSLDWLELDYLKYQEKYNLFKNDRKNKDKEKGKTDEEKNLRKQILEAFNKKSEEYLKNFPDLKFKKQDTDFLFEKEVFDILKQKYWNDQKTQITDEETWEITTIFDDWNGWLWYLTKFFETRKNLYKDDWTSTALATRIIDQNLKRFCDNLEAFNKIKDKINITDLENGLEISLNEIFSLDFYNKCVLQDGIQFYNDIIWWRVVDNHKKIPWVNEYINKYRQDNSWDKPQYLQKLDKQILSEKKEDFIKQIKDKEELKQELKIFFENSNKKVDILKYIFENLWNYSDEDYKKIYISKLALNTISHKFTDKTKIFEWNLFEIMKKDKLLAAKDHNKKEDSYKFPDFISLYYIKKSFEEYNEKESFWKARYYKEYDKDWNLVSWFLEENINNLWNEFCEIFKYEFDSLLLKVIKDVNWKEKKIWYNIAKESLEKILGNFDLNEETRVKIKDFADLSKVIYQMWKYFAVEKKREWDNNYELNSDFYDKEWSEEKQEYWYREFYNNAYEEIIVPYNLIRNYLSKKPWDDSKKWKLNFESSSLLKWWDKNFETYWSYIFKKWDLYYLWIINWTKLNKSEVERLNRIENNNVAKRFIYNFQKPDNKNTPRLFIRSKWDNFAPSVSELNLPIDDIIDIYDKRLFSPDKKNPNLHKPYLVKLIDYFKIWFSKHESYKHFNFVWKDSNKYENIAEFYRDVEKSCYKPNWEEINYNELLKLTEEKRIYLFQIYNKNFELDESIAPENYVYKWNWKDNVHTAYFKWLFQKENTENKNWVNIKLSWWWEVFFRPKAIDKKIDKNRKFKREIIENKRYSKEKILLHFPIQLNFKENKTNNFNKHINSSLAEFLKNNQDINIIWIDRWEKHLAYYSVINQKQERINSWTLNHIYQKNNNWDFIQKAEKKIEEKRDDEWNIIDYELVETWKLVNYQDYWLLLDYKEKKRRLERQSWKEVEQIKDLKKWYISAVVRKIADLIIEHNAIVVFEDLNMRFKQIRWWIEKSVYQQLEKALIDKLNFLVNKWELNSNKAWNLLKAYQLTSPFTTFKEMWKQTWIIFYTQASYTSKIDPVTGWRPNLYLKKQSAEINKKNILKFENIIFNKEKDRFEITYDLKNFLWKDSKFPDKTKWTLCTCVERWKWDRFLNLNKWWYKPYKDLTDNFKELFKDYNIKIDWDIKKQIENLDCEDNKNKKLFSSFIELWSLLCQIRNTDDSEKAKKEWKDDIIFSPVEPFFDSRKSEEFWKHLPKNWDDNGAFNIARKGISILEKIWDWKKENEELKNNWKKEKNYPDLFISNQDWDNFITKNHKI